MVNDIKSYELRIALSLCYLPSVSVTTFISTIHILSSGFNGVEYYIGSMLTAVKSIKCGQNFIVLSHEPTYGLGNQFCAHMSKAYIAFVRSASQEDRRGLLHF